MSTTVYIALTIAVLALVMLVVFIFGKSKRTKPLTPLAGIALAFVLAALLLGEDQLIGYALMGAGVLLALIDMFRWSKNA